MSFCKKAIVVLLVFCALSTIVVAEGQKEEAQEKIVITVGDNLTDRVNGFGRVAEVVNERFLELHPEVEFKTESYQDQIYQQKIKIYATADQLPDVMKYWSLAPLIKPLIDADLLLPLDKEKFSKMNWLSGSLENNIYDGELYGIPLSADFMVVFYNQAIFDECGIEVPTTYEDMLSAATVLKEAGYIPMITDGKDGWPLSINFDYIMWRKTGDFSMLTDAIKGKKSFTDPEFLEAARDFQEFFCTSDLFQNDLVTTDYGSSRNLFGQERAAMYLMGAWEMGLAGDENFSQRFRDNVRAMAFPTFADKPENRTQLLAWYGGNYTLSSKAENRELLEEYIEFYANNYAEIVWDLELGFPAQPVTAKEDTNALTMDLLNMLNGASETSGTAIFDRTDPVFKGTHQKLCKDLAAGVITPEEFCDGLDAAYKKMTK